MFKSNIILCSQEKKGPIFSVPFLSSAPDYRTDNQELQKPKRARTTDSSASWSSAPDPDRHRETNEQDRNKEDILLRK